jgi:hypothetical protein
MSRRSGFWGVLAAALAVTGSGCGGPVPVEGRVTLDGQPVEKAAVVFEREDGAGRPASATTDSDGVFHLTTYKPGDGALPGQYKVIITPPVNYTEIEGHPGMTFAERMELHTKGREALRGKPPPFGADMPMAVRDPAKTPLRQAVPPDGPVAFDLQSEGPKTAKPARPATAKKDPTKPFEPTKKDPAKQFDPMRKR